MKHDEDDYFDYAREKWGEGPWTGEPDRVEFRHHGYPCLLNRNPVGAWCGYVAVPPGHPWHGLEYDDVQWHYGLGVHGGLTFAGECGGHICHVVEPGEPDNVWWLGFDCAQAGDYVPGLEGLLREMRAQRGRTAPSADGVYRDIAYVTDEVRRLAESAQEAAR